MLAGDQTVHRTVYNVGSFERQFLMFVFNVGLKRIKISRNGDLTYLERISDFYEKITFFRYVCSISQETVCDNIIISVI